MASRAPHHVPTGSRLRQVGWALALALCVALFLALTFRVNAVKSEVRLAEREIIAVERQMLILEVEFETRASQRQLSDWNRIEFGFVPPGPGQIMDGRRQLAALGSGTGPNAPSPIRVAMAQPVEDDSLLAEWLDSEGDDADEVDTDGAEARRTPDGNGDAAAMSAGNLAQRLSRGTASLTLAAEVAP